LKIFKLSHYWPVLSKQKRLPLAEVAGYAEGG
jgi:hypothetical protein